MTFEDLRRDVELAGSEAWRRYAFRAGVATQFVVLGVVLALVGLDWYFAATEGMVVPLEPNGVAIQAPADPTGVLGGPVLGAIGTMLVLVGVGVRGDARRRLEIDALHAVRVRGEWFEEARHV